MGEGDDMTEYKEHGERGHLNIYKRDHDSVITGYGVHDRVVAFLPGPVDCFVRVDTLWNLGMPTDKQIIKVMREDQGIKGKWEVISREPYPDEKSFEVILKRV